MTFEEFKSRFNNVKRSVDLYIDGYQFNYIDVASNTIFGTRYVPSSCGCCSEIEDIEIDLDYEFSYMNTDDKDELIKQLEFGNNN